LLVSHQDPLEMAFLIWKITVIKLLLPLPRGKKSGHGKGAKGIPRGRGSKSFITVIFHIKKAISRGS
ncbi:MAG: hypothetical protein DRN35_06525, partial [Thermoplasmata archaeon]